MLHLFFSHCTYIREQWYDKSSMVTRGGKENERLEQVKICVNESL